MGESVAAVTAVKNDVRDGWKCAGVVGALSGFGRQTFGSTKRLAGSAAVMTDNLFTGIVNTVSSLSGNEAIGVRGNVMGFADCIDATERGKVAGSTPMSLYTLDMLM